MIVEVAGRLTPFNAETPKSGEKTRFRAGSDYSIHLKDILEEEGADIEEFEEDLENGDIIITDEPEELTYEDKIQIIVDDGKWALVYGAICLVGGTVLNPLMWVFPPVGAALLIAGIPLGLLMTVIGAGKIITSPIAALFYDGTGGLF